VLIKQSAGTDKCHSQPWEFNDLPTWVAHCRLGQANLDFFLQAKVVIKTEVALTFDFTALHQCQLPGMLCTYWRV